MKGFLTGLGLGAGLALLFAPEAGECSRRALRENFAQWLNFLRGTQTGGELQEEFGSLPDTGDSEWVEREKEAEPPDHSRSSTAEVLNSISREELMNVDGIGPVLADKIISNRPYSSAQELLERRILPQNTFAELQRALIRQERLSA
jgi:gas vesicle protein